MSTLVDLRSDTVTRPTAAMRRAMASADVGDDVYGEDPTVNLLQERAAQLFEREAGLFVPSGCMGNLVAIKSWTRPGNEVICEQRAHVNQYELASMSAVAGCMPRPAAAPGGILTWDLISPLVRPKTYYYSQTGLVTIENTHNMAGGTVTPPHICVQACEGAHARGIPAHLDGARIFNAAAALGKSVADISRGFDSIMFCFSKGLGAPVGSMVLGSRDFIEQARVHRKMLGGGMRQAGILAAACLVALEDSPKRLPLDHENAHRLAEGLAQLPGIALDPGRVMTNIIVFGVEGTGRTAAEICAALAEKHILASPFEKYVIRMVTHCDVDHAGIDRAIAAAAALLSGKN